MKFVLFLFVIMTSVVSAQQQPVELGNVHWLRDFDAARTQSERLRRPLLILFQEIPGCATCRNYGSHVLTHPLLVEAIETHFVPLAIYNNKGGADAVVLKTYNEPAWNNPVVRIVDASGADVVSRLSGDYSAAGLAHVMTEALIRTTGSAPAWLHLLNDELSAARSGTELATYAMYCFWTGEALFGKLNGVVRTTAGFQNGREVVAVEYNPAVISKEILDRIAREQQCAISEEGSFQADATPKYYLSRSKYQSVPMTEIQKCRVNAALREHLDPSVFLSSRQLAFLDSDRSVNCVPLSLSQAWEKVNK